MPTSHDTLSANDFKLRSIDLYLTSDCNRRCAYCFLPDSYFASHTRMATSTVRQILDWAAGGPIEEITLLGGEPALHPAFTEIAAEVVGRHLHLRTVTNGSRRFREALATPPVRAALGRVAVSLDAPDPGTVERLRGRGAYADALATIEDLRRAGIPFDVNCTPLASTVDTVPEMLRVAELLGADRLNIHWFSQVGRARRYAAGEAVGAADWRAKVLDPVSRYRPTRQGFEIDCELAYAYGLPGEDPGRCAVRDVANLQFLPDGSVFSCGILLEHPERSGYLFRDGTLVRRTGESELTGTRSDCPGCPLRAPDAGYLPVCVYNRLALG